MARPYSYLLTDPSTGAPLTTATPSWVAYADRSGNARTPPAAPTHIGGGRYAFTPSDADEAVGVCYLIDNGAGASPTREAGAVPDTGDFIVFELEDGDGVLWAGAAPTVGAFTDFGGGARPATPSPVAAAGAYLWSLTPSAADLVAGVSARIDAPAGAWPQYLAFDFSNRYAAARAVTAGQQVDPIGVMVAALRDYLTGALPGAVDVINLRRAAVLLSQPGPFVIPVGATLKLDVSREGTGTAVTLPVGASVTAAQVAQAIGIAAPPGITASIDSNGRHPTTGALDSTYDKLQLTATATPTTLLPSVVCALGDVTGADANLAAGNAALGWDSGGEYVANSSLRAPTWRGVSDGWPVAVPDASQGFWVVIDDRKCVDASKGPKQDTYVVNLTLRVLKPEANDSSNYCREGVTSALAAVAESLLATIGRYLAREAHGDVMMTRVASQDVGGRSIKLTQGNVGYLHDVASCVVVSRVHQRPANSG